MIIIFRTAAIIPYIILPVAPVTSAPVNAKCQKSQISISRVCVVLVRSITIFTTSPIGIIRAPTLEANAIAAAAGHPTSITVRLRPSLVTISCAAGPRLPPNKPITKFKPINPTPTVNPALKAFPNFAPRMRPNIVIIIGIIT